MNMKGQRTIQQLHLHYGQLFLLLEHPARAQQLHEYEEWVHHLRVEIKKMKAIYLFMEKVYDLPNRRKLTAPAQKLFDKAAAVRELQLMLQKMPNAPAHTTKHLQQQLKRANSALDTYSKKALIQLRQAWKKTQHYAAHFKQNQKKNFFRHLLHRVVLGLHQPEQVDQLHDTRKQVKALLHLKALAPQRFSNIIPWKKLEQIATRIGDWHDEVVMRQQIAHIKFKHTPSLLWQQEALQKLDASQKRLLQNLQQDLARHRIL